MTPVAPYHVTDGSQVRDAFDVLVLDVDPLGFYLTQAEREAFAVKVVDALNAMVPE